MGITTIRLITTTRTTPPQTRLGNLALAFPCPPTPSAPSGSMKMKLTDQDVLEIFSQRAQVNNYESNALTSKELSRKYGISERTVRDIWSRRTRRDLTQQAWTLEERLSQKSSKKGRPLGAKDGAPRQRQSTQRANTKTYAQCTSENGSDAGTERRSDVEETGANLILDQQHLAVRSETGAGQVPQHGQQGILLNQAVMALLKQGMQPGQAMQGGVQQPAQNGGNLHPPALASKTISSSVLDALRAQNMQPSPSQFQQSQQAQSTVLSASAPSMMGMQMTNSAGPPTSMAVNHQSGLPTQGQAHFPRQLQDQAMQALQQPLSQAHSQGFGTLLSSAAQAPPSSGGSPTGQPHMQAHHQSFAAMSSQAPQSFSSLPSSQPPNQTLGSSAVQGASAAAPSQQGLPPHMPSSGQSVQWRLPSAAGFSFPRTSSHMGAMGQGSFLPCPITQA